MYAEIREKAGNKDEIYIYKQYIICTKKLFSILCFLSAI